MPIIEIGLIWLELILVRHWVLSFIASLRFGEPSTCLLPPPSPLSADLGLTYGCRQLQSLDAAKSAFFSNASHELRTPLTLISGPLEEILSLSSNASSYPSEPPSTLDPAESRSGAESRTEPRFSKALSKIHARATLATRNVTRLTRLVDSLLDFSKIEGGKMRGCFRPVYIGGFTVDLASLFRSVVERSSIEVGFLFDSSSSFG